MIFEHLGKYFGCSVNKLIVGQKHFMNSWIQIACRKLAHVIAIDLDHDNLYVLWSIHVLLTWKLQQNGSLVMQNRNFQQITQH
jgi:hypothetical protein